MTNLYKGIAIAVLLAAAAPAGAAEDSYPTKPIRMIVPYAVGGATDILIRARAFGESRMVCGVHNMSAIEAGRTNGSIVVTLDADLQNPPEEIPKLLAKVAEMPKADRDMAERIHAIVKASAPDLSPKTWYGMPAYAKDGKVVCFFKSADKFKSRYATFGFEETAPFEIRKSPSRSSRRRPSERSPSASATNGNNQNCRHSNTRATRSHQPLKHKMGLDGRQECRFLK